ncbi:hypothetical protein J4Y15_17440, partial [Escherichia coli]
DRMAGRHPAGAHRTGHAGGGTDAYPGRTLNNATAILRHVALTRRRFSAHRKILFYYFNDSIFIRKSEEKLVVTMN